MSRFAGLLWTAASCGAGEPSPDPGVDSGGAPPDSGDVQPDGAPGGLDASIDAEAPGRDSGVPCEVDGVSGECIDVSDCTGDRSPTPGHCPGPAEIQCCTRRSGGECDPAAHPLPNEGLVEEEGQDGCPGGMLRVGEFCIDRFEASLELVEPPGAESSWSPYWNPGEERVRAVSIRGAVPQAYVSGRQAGSACEEAGKRLCTDDEWLRACQGPAGATYPYGDERVDGVCNDSRAQHPAVEYFGTAEDWIWSELDHPCLDQLPESLDPAGENDGCVTAEGAFDMMGNLHEWTADPDGTFRGGFFVDTVVNGEGCLYRTTAHDSSYWDYSTGFRCCVD
ncbi:MAG: SUMF1/EgtB/PvdO family nonheme iron enzyme [Deltaproteobacteria bacterium]|nr:SUMF1/EgtB/PvdO family nonheme iron enzyme [Deltaproteobacteria bacterium]